MFSGVVQSVLASFGSPQHSLTKMFFGVPVGEQREAVFGVQQDSSVPLGVHLVSLLDILIQVAAAGVLLLLLLLSVFSALPSQSVSLSLVDVLPVVMLMLDFLLQFLSQLLSGVLLLQYVMFGVLLQSVPFMVTQVLLLVS